MHSVVWRWHNCHFMRYGEWRLCRRLQCNSNPMVLGLDWIWGDRLSQSLIEMMPFLGVKHPRKNILQLRALYKNSRMHPFNHSAVSWWGFDMGTSNSGVYWAFCVQWWVCERLGFLWHSLRSVNFFQRATHHANRTRACTKDIRARSDYHNTDFNPEENKIQDAQACLKLPCAESPPLEFRRL